MADHLSREYRDYIKSPAWKRKRALYFESTRIGRCQGCGDKEKLHVHHKTYERLGNEDLADLVAVCQTCHTLIHQRNDLGGVTLEQATDLVLESIRRHRRSVNRRRAVEVGRTNVNADKFEQIRERQRSEDAAAIRRRNGL